METNLLHPTWHGNRRVAMDCWLKHRLKIASYKSHNYRHHQNIIAHGAQTRPQSIFRPPHPYHEQRYSVMYVIYRTLQCRQHAEKALSLLVCSALNNLTWWHGPSPWWAAELEVMLFIWKASLTYLCTTLLFRPDAMMLIRRRRSTFTLPSSCQNSNSIDFNPAAGGGEGKSGVG
jgi:hypothetical protein